ncbi:hypothetical protein BC629DRAFT_1447878 [Irpex lacteus]|nr:hypothetical protein BC629DRAFT_1447878 [Irpex lacteus]
MTPAFFALLMRDAAKLLQPATVVALSDPTGQRLDEHPSANALLAFSDISNVFQLSASKKTSTNPTVAKLAFYAARIINTPSSVLIALSSEAIARAKLVEREGESAQSDQLRGGDAGRGGRGEVNTGRTGHTVPPRIVELT